MHLLCFCVSMALNSCLVAYSCVKSLSCSVVSNFLSTEFLLHTKYILYL
jgi:hypothetical protein